MKTEALSKINFQASMKLSNTLCNRFARSGVIIMLVFLTLIEASLPRKASATLIIEYGSNDYVTSNTAINAGTNHTDYSVESQTKIRIYPYSATAPVTPAGPYSGPDIYRSWQIARTGVDEGVPVDAFTNVRINNNLSGYDAIELRIDESYSRIMTGITFFKPTELGTFAFNEGDELSARVNFLEEGIVRMAVMSDGVWYLSESYTDANGRFRIADASLENWSSGWDPTDTAPFSWDAPKNTTGGLAYNTPGSALQNIEAAGIWFYYSRESGLGHLRLQELEINATAVPETTTLSYSALFGVLVYSWRKSRRRRVASL